MAIIGTVNRQYHNVFLEDVQISMPLLSLSINITYFILLKLKHTEGLKNSSTNLYHR